MHGSTNYFYATFQCCLMHFQSVKSCSAKSRDQGRMNIDHPVSVFCDHFRRDHHQVACQYDQIRLIGIYAPDQCLIKFCSGLIILRRNTFCLDPMFRSPRQCICIFIIADNSDDLCIRNPACIHRIQDRLQICSAAGKHLRLHGSHPWFSLHLPDQQQESFRVPC